MEFNAFPRSDQDTCDEKGFIRYRLPYTGTGSRANTALPQGWSNINFPPATLPDSQTLDGQDNVGGWVSFLNLQS
jgi:hypothetical protein